MKPLVRHCRPALAVALLALVTIDTTSNACNEATSIGGLPIPGTEGFLLSEGELQQGDSPLPDLLSGATTCPTPPCANATCGTVNPATPFQRLPGHISAPISRRAGCFGIAKKDNLNYLQLTLDGAPGSGTGFHRNVSTDGGFTWTDGPVVIGTNTHWWTGIKCPDPHYLPDGSLVVYFKASGSTPGIARAVSTDDGLTWTPDPAPVLTSGSSATFVDNPSAIYRYGNVWMMAYTVGCVGESTPFQLAETHIAMSTDGGLTWTKSPLNPALVPGGCNDWDQGAIANPVLMNDPNSNAVVHLFYTGADWINNTTRGCAKIGHAISTNYGRTWCKTGVVLDKPPVASGAWDDVQYMVSSYTLENNNKIRMYYWAQGAALGSGLGIAEADWPLAGCGPLTEPDRSVSLGSDRFAESDADLTDLLDGSIVYLRSYPNPTGGAVVIEHNLRDASARGAGHLRVFDVVGREVATAWSGQLEDAPDHFAWNGLDRSGSRVAAGRYLLRLEAGGRALSTAWLTVTPQ
ncbi:MAG: hypothetical protein R3E97_23735 [Candidatus Eisenbacteria bacterium]